MRSCLWALFGALSACTCAQQVCDATLCAGCCDAVGICHAGFTLTQCGVAGERCHACSSGESCSSGVCVETRVAPDAGLCTGIVCMNGTTCDGRDGLCRCGGTTCGPDRVCEGDSCVPSGDAGHLPCDMNTCRFGCCASVDTCALGTSALACGVFGQMCRVCPAGTICSSGTCFGGPDAGSCLGCPGCCSGNTCLPGTAQTACGRFGSMCELCLPAQICDADAGFCRSTCSPANCAGCCDSFGACQVGNGNAACGRFGDMCTNCVPQGAGAFCDAGACVVPPRPCSFSCSGCCDGETCIAPAARDDTHCGSSGEACFTCSAPSHCINGYMCFNPDGGFCAGNTCPNGCCDSAECLPGNTDTKCGRGVCRACAAGTSCTFGACLAPGPGCGPQSCGTCCTNGHCLSGELDLWCGIGGVTCAACPDGEHCLGNRCRGAHVGDPCDVDAGCAPTFGWFQFCRGDFPGGYCTTGCDAGACPGSTVCAGTECHSRCDAGTDCRPGYTCSDAGTCEP